MTYILLNMSNPPLIITSLGDVRKLLEYYCQNCQIVILTLKLNFFVLKIIARAA